MRGPTLLILLATTGFVLLLVAANVANLALARVMGRERELAVRTALGAGRGRIARQLLTESTMLAVAGGALGLRLRLSGARPARRLHRALHAARRRDLHRRHGARLHTRRVGLHRPAVRTAARRSRAGRSASRRRATGRSAAARMGARNALIVAQVAISFVLLVGAGLLVRSFIKLQQVDGGFRTDRVITMVVSLDFVKYNTANARRTFFKSVLDKVEAEPGVQAAALGFTVPLDERSRFSRAADDRGSVARRSQRASAGRLQVRVAGLLPDHRHDAAERPAVHRLPTMRRRRRWRSSICRWRGTFSRTSIRSDAAFRSTTAAPG